MGEEERAMFPEADGLEQGTRSADQQRKDKTHRRIREGDLSVPEWVTESKEKKPYFPEDKEAAFLKEKDKKMRESVDAGWEDIKAKKFKL